MTELSTILSSGDISEIYLGGTNEEHGVQTKHQTTLTQQSATSITNNSIYFPFDSSNFTVC